MVDPRTSISQRVSKPRQYSWIFFSRLEEIKSLLWRTRRCGYNAGRRSSKGSWQESDLPDNTDGRCCTNGPYATSLDILYNALHEHAPRGRKNIGGENALLWSHVLGFYGRSSLVYCGVVGVVNSTEEVTDGLRSIKLSVSRSLLRGKSHRSCRPVFYGLFKTFNELLAFLMHARYRGIRDRR